ncbi:MAG: hypothetical protein O6922_08235, partial [Chloroflexi bacterium]|nr:hypothetical protein [Chloroflexota bacterium]
MDGSSGGCDTFAMSKIPVSREEITAEWLAEQLSGLGDCEIAELEHEEWTGHNPELSQLCRIRVEYATRMQKHPDVVIVKIPPADE